MNGNFKHNGAMKMKRYSMIRGRISGAAGLLWVLLLCSTAVVQAAYVVTTQGQRVDGTDIRARANGEIILTTPQGTRTFYPGQYVKAVADKPAEVDRAAQLVAAKRFDDAIKLLEEVVSKYRFLDWDNQARVMIAVAQGGKGDHVAAVSTYEKLFAANPKSREEGDIVWAYRQAMLDAKQFDKLESQLREVIASGSRTDAARAQVMRGDINMAQSQVELAAMDYLRTVVLFKAEKAVQPDALMKAADALEKLRDARAKDMYRMLVEEYPASPQAQAAKGKI